MFSTRIIIFIFILCGGLHFAAPTPVSAKTWFVERDGTGDYIVIQDAVDAAASGDTIKLGLGRFDERHYVTSPGWSEYVRVKVTQYELTIIGSGSGTIIGQDYPWEPDQGMHKGIATGGLWGNQILRVENLHIENERDGIYTSHESKVWNLLEVKDCSFNGNYLSLGLLSDGGTVSVENCSFQNSTTEGVSIIGWNQMEMEIRGCTFTRSNNIYSTRAISLSGIQNTIIENCDIFEGTTGVTISYSSQTSIKNCKFSGQQNVALTVPENANVFVENCLFSNQAVALNSMTSDVQIEMVDSVVEDASDCSFKISTIQSLNVHNCDLAKGERGVVYVTDNPNCPNFVHLDMANNYWGTDEPDSIRAWIRDRYDTDEACYWVDFEPFLSGPTPTESPSLGGLKAMFR